MGQAGLVGLVAPHVENQGVITATLGRVQLASGDGFMLDMVGDGITQVVVSPQVMQQLVGNSGTIIANGGRIQLTAAAAANAVDALVINTGKLRADTFSQQDGTIQLTATNGTVTNTGEITARGNNPGDSGGNVSISAQNVQQSGTINVKGQASGGSVNIAFSNSYTDTPSSSITASGVSGNGGSINVSGANPSTTLTASGTYQATSQSGQGGSVAVAAGTVNLQGAKLDASGATGGQVTVRYTPASTMTTQTIAIDSATTLHADGTQGAGGSIVLDGETMTVEGILSAMGMIQGGTINIDFVDSYTDTIDTTLTVASTSGNGGGVYVEGGDNASITASGTYIADGGTTGGSIDFLAGQDIFLLGAYLSAEGQFGGGAVRIGGDFHGAGTLRRSQYTTVDANTRIIADATNDGDGGKVAVWSDGSTVFDGTISAKGGPNGGDGGYVETSGHMLTVNGNVNASAPQGTAGQWLLDPNNLVINTSATSNAGSSPNWTAGAGTGNVLNTDSDTALSAGTSVILTASGSITFSASISKTAGGDATLTADAGTDTVVNSGATISSTVGKLNIIFDADTAAGGGAISIAASITTNGGNITVGGQGSPSTLGAVGDATYVYGVYINAAALSAGGGNISLIGTSYTGNSSNPKGVQLDNDASVSTTGSGTITITGTSTGSDGFDHGVAIGGPSSVSSVDGAITITGSAGSGSSSDGVHITDGSTITATGIGAITINGTGGNGSSNTGINVNGGTVSTNSGALAVHGAGGSGSGGNNYGLYLNSGTSASVITSTSGNITITGIDGSGGSNDQGFATDSTAGNKIGTTSSPATSSNITLIADDWNIANTSDFAVHTTGNIVIKSYDSGTTMGIGSGSGTLALTSAILGDLNLGSTSSITFGDTTNTAAMTINYTTAFTKPVTFDEASGMMSVSGTLTSRVSSGSAITLTNAGGGITLASSKNIVETTGGAINISANGAFTTSGTNVIGGASATGAVTMDANALSLSSTSPNNTIETTGTITIALYSSGTTMGVGSGSGTLSVTDTDLGYFNLGSASSVTLGSASVGSLDFNDSIRTFSKPLTLLSSGNITLDSQVNSSAAGGSGPVVVVAASGNFINNYGAGVFNLTGASSPAWAVYSTAPASDTNGANVLHPATATYSQTYTSDPPSGLASGTNWIFSSSAINLGTITITASGQTVTYGTAPDTSPILNTTYTCSGSGSACSDITGSPALSISGSVTTSTSGNYNAGTWTNDILSALGSLAFNYGYTGSFSFADGTLSALAKALSITGVTANNKTYDGTASATLNTGSAALSGTISGDTVSLGTGSASGTFASANVANGIRVTTSGFTISGADAGNYTLTQPTATANITPAALSITANNQTMTYGDGNSYNGFTASGLVGGQTVGSVSYSTNANTSTSGNWNAGTWSIIPSNATGGTFNPSNYSITYNVGTLAVNPRPLTVSASAQDKTYDATTNVTVTLSDTVGQRNGQIGQYGDERDQENHEAYRRAGRSVGQRCQRRLHAAVRPHHVQRHRHADGLRPRRPEDRPRQPPRIRRRYHARSSSAIGPESDPDRDTAR